MDKRSDRLQTVLKLAQIRQRLAAEQLGEMTRNAQALEQQEDQLRHYQLDYGEHFKTLGSAGSTPGLLRNYQGFFQQLDRALDTQRERLVLARNQREASRRQWQNQYAREKNLEKLVQRTVQEEQQATEKKQQRELDDRPPAKPL